MASNLQDKQLSEQKRCALVTGSSNGIGEEIVKQLAALDYKLIVTGRNKADIERVVSECCSLSPSHETPLGIVANLECEQDVERLFNESIRHFNGRLDALINNAGYSTPIDMHSQPQECYTNFKRTFAINLNAAVALVVRACPYLETTARTCCEGRPTSVVNVSSIAAQRPLDDFAYCTSKCALSMLSNCLAGALGSRLVRVNCVCPGPIETKIIERGGKSLDSFKELVARVTPLQRIGQAEEVAHAVLFLIDQQRASYITGSQLTVDGGSLWAQIKW